MPLKEKLIKVIKNVFVDFFRTINIPYVVYACTNDAFTHMAADLFCLFVEQEENLMTELPQREQKISICFIFTEDEY